ncbi:MAG: lipid-binding SYLF domain-containing protein [Pseudomonadota bacterium]|nr:lipid-binding SYLF domain-containing protein [Pseudomonadota bacterium]
MNDRRVLVTACIFALMSASGLAGAQAGQAAVATTAPASKQEATADKHVNDAVAVAQRMLAEPRMKELLQQAKGVFIVPTYGRAALGVGASGGAGVLVVKRADGSWSDPAFYNIGGINVGAQIGAEGGAIAMVLNNEKAVNKFMQNNTFALNAAAGLTIVNWAKIAQGSLGDGDIVAWAGTKGLYGNLVAVGVSDIRYNQKLTNAYYHQTVSASDAVAGKYSNAQAEPLKQALASAPATTAH